MKTFKGLEAFLNENVPLIDQEMYKILPERDPLPFLYEPMRDYPQRGGKRFRPALVLLACEALGGDRAEALRTAAAFEMLQSFLLVHDDIEDGSEMRRGRPCLHRIHGIPLAINVGDALYTKVFEILLANGSILGTEKTLRLIDEMVRGTQETCEGQAYDVGWIGRKEIPTVDDFMMMLRKKTGWYSGMGPCVAGAIIAGADRESEKAIGEFGESIAIAFQIRDDLLNLTVQCEDASGAPEATDGSYGKERGGDIAEGKRTLMIVDLFHKCTEDEKTEVLRILDKDRALNTRDEIEWVISLLERYGSIQYAQEVCRRKAQRGREYLNLIPESDAKEILKEMSEFLIERTF